MRNKQSNNRSANSDLCKQTKWAGAFVILLLLTNCGKKKKNIFVFQENPKKQKVRKLHFVSVNNIHAQKIDNGILLSWSAPSKNFLRSFAKIVLENKTIVFSGYHLYRFYPYSFIPRKPLNKKTLYETQFLDKTAPKNKPLCYLIRMMFTVNNTRYEGPASSIVSIKNTRK